VTTLQSAAGRGSLSGWVALVTGAGRGIGACVSQTLAGAGAGVALVARTTEELEVVASEIITSGGQAYAISADLALAGSASEVVARTIKVLGRVDILVNNAALQLFGPVLEFQEDAFRATVDVNLTAPFALAKAVLPDMISRGEGWIVTIASDLAYRVRVGGGAAYCSTKRALLALSEVLQLEHRADGIRVSVILPGISATTWDGLPSGHLTKAEHLRPSEIGEAVLWCCTRTSGARVDTIVIHPSVQDSV
jgi:NAD(P)-dependent dehydrogenase (short-subunit alcohol dehydrogenase family)